MLAGVLCVIGMLRNKTPRPISNLATKAPDVTEQTCTECHADIVADFKTSPHANTLRKGMDAELRGIFADQIIQKEGRTFSFFEHENELWYSSDDLDYQRRVDWFFGSGRHALTPVSMDDEGLTQLNISYFSDGEFRTTPGVSLNQAGIPHLGEHQSEEDARRCFGCHVSRMNDESITNLKPGLDCTRCHFGSEEHARSSGGAPTSPSWQELSALESVNRCGECHRRADEMKPEEISIHERHLVRFAPVGLVMSRCFQTSNSPENVGAFSRFDCITCHDPHLPSQTNPSYFEAICRSCHTPPVTQPKRDPAHFHSGPENTPQKAGPIVACSDQPSDSACLSCHMPKREFAPGLQFTDHWIR